jgi:hypothetical protein
MSDYAKGVKIVPFDGTKEIFCLWTTQLLGLAATFKCKQAILGTVTLMSLMKLKMQTSNNC